MKMVYSFPHDMDIEEEVAKLQPKKFQEDLLLLIS